MTHFSEVAKVEGLQVEEGQVICVDGPDDWTVAEESDHDDPTEYEIVRMVVEPVAKRTFPTPAPDVEDEL